MSNHFVCVRLVKCNQLDLTLFQFDYDLTFAAFFLNHDRTIYARYGTRTSLKGADSDVSTKGLAETMKSVLQLHRDYPANRSSLAGKQPHDIQHKTPESFAALKHYAPELDYAGQVAKSCIHCHQIRDAQRRVHREAGGDIPAKLLFPYPAPDSIGIELDPESRARIRRVIAGSVASRSGLNRHDQIDQLNGQPITSTADLQWVLHHARDGQRLVFSIIRDGKAAELTLTLPDGWRNQSDISWRPTTWDLRRMATGGMVLVPLSQAEKQQMGIHSGMALRVQHVGLYGDHATAHRAGVKKGDVLISFDGRQDLATESSVIRHAIKAKRPGDAIALRLLRGDQPRQVVIRLQ